MSRPIPPVERSEAPGFDARPPGPEGRFARLAPRRLPYQLGRYLLTERLGEGGMATVFRAELNGPGGFRKSAAIKLIRSHPTGGARLTRALLREARLGAGLSHPNVLSVHDCGEHEGEVFIVMELVEGASLDDILSLAQPPPPAVAKELVLQICRGMHHAHELRQDGVLAGVVHRDLKPANILLSRIGVVKVADFGIAKATQLGDHTTLDGSTKGTPAFMSPEQVLGEELDRRSDIFSLGSVAYTVFTGTDLFGSDNAMTTMMQVIRVDAIAEKVRAFETANDLLPGLGDILRDCLSVAPERRPQTARELQERLEALPSPPTEPQSLETWARESIAAVERRDAYRRKLEEALADRRTEPVVAGPAARPRRAEALVHAATLAHPSSEAAPLEAAQIEAALGDSDAHTLLGPAPSSPPERANARQPAALAPETFTGTLLPKVSSEAAPSPERTASLEQATSSAPRRRRRRPTSRGTRSDDGRTTPRFRRKATLRWAQRTALAGLALAVLLMAWAISTARGPVASPSSGLVGPDVGARGGGGDAAVDGPVDGAVTPPSDPEDELLAVLLEAGGSQATAPAGAAAAEQAVREADRVSPSEPVRAPNTSVRDEKTTARASSPGSSRQRAGGRADQPASGASETPSATAADAAEPAPGVARAAEAPPSESPPREASAASSPAAVRPHLRLVAPPSQAAPGETVRFAVQTMGFEASGGTLVVRFDDGPWQRHPMRAAGAGRWVAQLAVPSTTTTAANYFVEAVDAAAGARVHRAGTTVHNYSLAVH